MFSQMNASHFQDTWTPWMAFLARVTAAAAVRLQQHVIRLQLHFLLAQEPALRSHRSASEPPQGDLNKALNSSHRKSGHQTHRRLFLVRRRHKQDEFPRL